jgi:hypothetical protein
MNEIELLYFRDCPSWETGLENLRQALAAENIQFSLRLIEITSSQQAQDESFLGSPSFRLNGVDLWPESRSRYNMSCRIYQTNHGMRGSPSVEMLRERMRELMAG